MGNWNEPNSGITAIAGAVGSLKAGLSGPFTLNTTPGTLQEVVAARARTGSAALAQAGGADSTGGIFQSPVLKDNEAIDVTSGRKPGLAIGRIW